MFSQVFLAQTGGEMERSPADNMAYMGCHFSPYGKGLSNLPVTLPKGAMLLLDDSTPPDGHNSEVVITELKEIVQKYSVSSVILDFQGEITDESMDIAQHLVNALPCPVAVTEGYAKELGCPVFLSPTPVNMAIRDHIDRWLPQGVYLELAPMATCFTVTENGCTSLAMHYTEGLPLADTRLHCHYNVEVFPDRAVFTLCRTKEDLQALIVEAKQLGVLHMLGLYQELSRL